MSKATASQILQIERSLLRSLCVPQKSPSLVQSIIAQLQNYVWLAEENRVVFRALARLRGRELEHIRESLPAVSTRMGFPDVSWDDFFAPAGGQAGDPSELASSLLASQNK